MDKFCVIDQIVNKNTDAYVVFENEEFIAFLDKSPVFLGHTLLAPKCHIETLYDLPNALLEPFFDLAKKIGKAIEQAMEAKGSFMAINNRVSQSIPHLHLHLIPRNPKDGLRGFFWPRMKYQSEEQKREIHLKIRSFLSQQSLQK